jgi:hypothetical protein
MQLTDLAVDPGAREVNQRSAPPPVAILFFDFGEEIWAISKVIRLDLY